MDESAPVPAPARWRLLRRIGGGLAALVLLAAVLVLGLNTGPGRQFVARQISAMTFANGLRIGIGRIDGSLYGKARLIDVRAFDTRGEFLRAPTIDLDWRPLAYLRNHVDVRSVSAASILLERVPQLRAGPATGPLLPDLAIDVGSLRVDRLVAAPAVAGAPRVLGIAGQARIAERRAQVSARVVTLGAPGGDRLDLMLDAVPDANRLALRATLDAPRNGVLAALAGLRQGLAVRADGQGDWKRWDGTVNADLDASPFARLAISARDGTFAVRGPAEPGRLLTGKAAALLDASTRLDLAAALKDRRATLSGSLRSDGLVIVPAGVIDLSANRFDALDLDIALLRPGALAANLSGEAVRARLTLDGSFARPTVQYRLSAATLALDKVVLQRVQASGTARIDPGQIMIPVAARAARIAGLDSVAGGSLANVRLDGDFAIAGARVLSDNMRIRSDRIDARAVLLADTARGSYTGTLEGRINTYRVDSIGTFAIATSADLRNEGKGLSVTGTVRARSTAIVDPNVRAALGGTAVGSSQIAYGPDRVIRFSRLRMNSPLLRVFDGHGSYGGDGQLAISASGHSTRYGPLALELTGTIASPRAVLVAQSPGFGVGLAALRAEVIGSAGDYHLAATGQTDYGPLSADVTLAQGKGPLAVQVNRGDLAGIGFTGRIERTAAEPFAGQLNANGRGLAGIVRLDAAGRYQQALITLHARNTVLPGKANLSIGSAIVDARVVLYDRPSVVADVQLAQTRLRAMDIAAARGRIDYRDGRGNAQFLVEATGAVPFRLAGNAGLEPGLWRVALDGRVRGVTLRTASPMRIVPSAKGYELLPSRLDLGQGSLRLAGTYGTGLKLESRMDRLDMALINAFVPGYGIGGSATGSLDYEQASLSAVPRADARLSIDGFTRTTAVSVSQPVDINLVASLLGDGGEARAVIRRRGTVIGRMVASLRPLDTGTDDWISRIASAPLGGGIRYNGPADTLWSFAGASDQTLAGSIAVGADFSGRLQQPQLTGIVRGENLTYENQTYGTRLTGMALSGHFAGTRLQVERLSATAGSGTVQGQGSIGLAADEGYPMDMTFDLANARLARSDALSSTATGKLHLTKTAGQPALLSGSLRLPETRYELVRQGAADVPELSGVRFKPRSGQLRVTGNEPAAPRGSLLESLQFDVALEAPSKLFVTGMGLDSEWSANLRVGGSSAAPEITGTVDLVRGTLGFAGRQFALQEGRLLFTGGTTVDPQITLSASEDIDAVTVTVNATGRAFNPQIAFTSSPALPADEVLSRILFGNSVGQLSPLQAVQLAASLNALRGTGSGLNPLGKLRAATGLSRLRILAPEATTGRGTAIAAGHYITNNVYLELITDARGFTATQIEVGLSRTLSILSQAGGSGVTNFNLRFHKRY
ncbi:MAG: translocation/assembly module TamB domain-containing protein [Sphingomonadales bacterium]|nr:translocation/assembly module TamB domain-containing protein [Sphingomonadales bacterium]